MKDTSANRSASAIIKRTLRVAGKVLLYLVLLLVFLIVLLHLPSVQKIITHKISTYLTNKTKGRVDIDQLEFSILGNACIRGLYIWDPDSNAVLSAGLVEVKYHITDLLRGHWYLDTLRLESVHAHLVSDHDELNTQFLSDAFTTKTKTSSSSSTTIQIGSIIASDFKVDYLDTATGMQVNFQLRGFTGASNTLSSEGNTLQVKEICLDYPTFHMLITNPVHATDTSTASFDWSAILPDFGTGIGLKIDHVEIHQGEFAYHQDTVMDTRVFDPDHVSVHDIQLIVDDIGMDPDQFESAIQSFSFTSTGFTINDAGAGIQLNHHHLAVSDFRLVSNSNTLQADLTADYPDPITSLKDISNLTLHAKANIHPGEFSYFMSEKPLAYIKRWTQVECTADGHYARGVGQLNNFQIKTSNSSLKANGQVKDVFNVDKISWQDLAIQANIGTDFKAILQPYLDDRPIPPSIQLHVLTSGNPKNVLVDGSANSSWGNADVKGRVILLPHDFDLDMEMSGHPLQLTPITGQTMLGPVNVTAKVKGKIGDHQDAMIQGKITSIVLDDQTIHDITFQSHLFQQDVNSSIHIDDPLYPLKGTTDVSFADPMILRNQYQLDTFRIGHLLKKDSTLVLQGQLAADITIDASAMQGHFLGHQFTIANTRAAFPLDTFDLTAMISSSGSQLNYFTPKEKGTLQANFDLREFPHMIEPWLHNVLYPSPDVPLAKGNRTIQFDLDLIDDAPLQLMGYDIKQFSGIHATGQLDEATHHAELKINSGKFKGFDVTLDTLYGDLILLDNSIVGNLNSDHIFYRDYPLGDLRFDAHAKGESVQVSLAMSRDSADYLLTSNKFIRSDSGVYIFPTQFFAFGKDYHFIPDNPIFMGDSNIVFHDFRIDYDSMYINLDGDRHAFKASFQNLDLTQLNPLISTDTPVINKGYFTGTLDYLSGQQLNFRARMDSLILYQGIPLTVTLSANKHEDDVPFDFLLSNANNKLEAKGNYLLSSGNMEATLLMNIQNPEMFAFLYKDALKDLSGTLHGQASIHGPADHPQVLGSVRFNDLHFTTTSPPLTFNIPDDSIRIDHHGLTFDHLTLYDKESNPLTISGQVITENFPGYQYHLNIKADQYALVNNPDTVKGPLKGLLVLDGNLDLTGNEKDTYVKADVRVRDKTRLTYEMQNQEDVLLNTIGVVEFVDPGQLTDTLKAETPKTMYDSILQTLPEINVNAKIKVDENASLKVITDPSSGDFFEASGAANLEMSYDRTGNPQLAGNYTIKKGQYRVSFYGLVKKSFTLVPGSSINWSGSPESGEMDIKATYTVATNSIGLIGHEIGDNEKSIYKRTLEYIVGITIKGTLEKPVISFTLDLPQEDKSSYPVLANKLDRLQLPEFQSELNKQVFGLLVLGGFMPEANVGEIDQSQLATTAIYNSVNAILASQLNRFASQYVKGVNIDVGIQSFADYSTPGGKTQTAMDFRVSKSVFNDRLSFEVGGDFNLNSDQSGGNTGDNYRGDVAIIYDLTGNGDKQLKAFNNESYDIIYQEIRNTGLSLIFIREFDKGELAKAKAAAKAKVKGVNKHKGNNQQE